MTMHRITEPGPPDPATVKKPIPVPPKKPAWYELDWILPYRDLMGPVGATLVVLGIAMVHVPSSLVMAGFFVLTFWWMLGRIS